MKYLSMKLFFLLIVFSANSIAMTQYDDAYILMKQNKIIKEKIRNDKKIKSLDSKLNKINEKITALFDKQTLIGFYKSRNKNTPVSKELTNRDISINKLKSLVKKVSRKIKYTTEYNKTKASQAMYTNKGDCEIFALRYGLELLKMGAKPEDLSVIDLAPRQGMTGHVALSYKGKILEQNQFHDSFKDYMSKISHKYKYEYETPWEAHVAQWDLMLEINKYRDERDKLQKEREKRIKYLSKI